MSAERTASAAPAAVPGRTRRGRPTRAGWVVGILGALAHGILLWQAVDQYTAFRDIATAFGGSLRPGTLATLVGAILVPVVAFAFAALATRGRPVAARVLVMLAGLAAASALTVGLAALLPLL
ncbi:hypothetical protein C5C03_05425 [Clavibacter michiganensis]|uniref:hypothetical protein n=1 Tax=Clavibacter michiganensis TaxID=28447 RepID=UPI000CE7FCD0|nr:hypothetical protein [Clavibacter michiganensis]MDO4137905.1 hypothetical protein [Clavibacter michiganensis]PPF88844.1 hypothetical protein C5C03_05425 [Clavibacter michiganensis]PPF96552.1 hypothetical protein C5C05_06295 [Clavibacter michiganensis]